MTKNSKKEIWKKFRVGKKAKLLYAISNRGRLKSFVYKSEKGTILNGGTVDGYKVFGYTVHKKKTTVQKRILVHRLVATHFIPTKAKDKIFVLHLDYNRLNNRVSNLKWATLKQMHEHVKKSPTVILAQEKLHEFNRQRDGTKLTTATVRQLKKRLLNPNRKTTLKVLAEQHGVTVMTLHRIKTGENWGHLKV